MTSLKRRTDVQTNNRLLESLSGACEITLKGVIKVKGSNRKTNVIKLQRLPPLAIRWWEWAKVQVGNEKFIIPEQQLRKLIASDPVSCKDLQTTESGIILYFQYKEQLSPYIFINILRFTLMSMLNAAPPIPAPRLVPSRTSYLAL